MLTMLFKEIRLLLRSNKAFWFMLLTLLVAGGLFGFYWTVMSLSGGDAEKAERGSSAATGWSEGS